MNALLINLVCRKCTASRCLAVLIAFVIMDMHGLAQNVGIGTSEPTEKLEVAGKVFSSDEGFKFPDGSVQTRAYNAYEQQDAAENRGIVILDLPGIEGSFSYGAHVNEVRVIDLDWGTFHNVTEAGVLINDVCHFKLLQVTKDIDKSSPKLFAKWAMGQVLNPVILYFLRWDPQTEQYVDYYKIIFTGVFVVKFEEMVKYTGGDNYAHLEIVTFSYSADGGDITLYWYGPPVVQEVLPPGGCIGK